MRAKRSVLHSTMEKTFIDLNEKFPEYPHAPCVEAIIDIRVEPENLPEEQSLKTLLQSSANGYAFANSIQAFNQQITFTQEQPQSPTVQWLGLQLRSKDQKYVAQFRRDGFALSRLQPYENWTNLLEEAMRLWKPYADFVRPKQVNRLGLRYVNVIEPNFPLQQPADFGDYVYITLPTPEDFDCPITSFLHQQTMQVPGHPYAINIIKTMRPSRPPMIGFGFILDIDVATTQPFPFDNTDLRKSLNEMRWLKNKVFFGSITDTSKRIFSR